MGSRLSFGAAAPVYGSHGSPWPEGEIKWPAMEEEIEWLTIEGEIEWSAMNWRERSNGRLAGGVGERDQGGKEIIISSISLFHL